MNELQKLPNVGQVLADHFVRIGINTPEQLRAKKAEAVFLTIRQQCDAGACLHMLYGIEGRSKAFPKPSSQVRESKNCAFFSIN